MSAHDEEPMFIGWAAASPRTARTSIARALVMAAVAVGLGAGVAGSMRSPGAGLLPFRAGERLEGLLVSGPTPLLLVADGEGGAVRAVVLANMARGAPDASVLAHDGEIVRLEGNLLERDGRRMLEVGAVEAASLAPVVEALLRAVHPEPVGHRTLVGEIVDSKCYLGRMRPGAGRTHRACAQSCVGGGVPPILVTHGVDGERHHALEGEDGGSIRLELLPYLTEPVELEGEVFRFADLYVVRVDVAAVRRL